MSVLRRAPQRPASAPLLICGRDLHQEGWLRGRAFGTRPAEILREPDLPLGKDRDDTKAL